MPYLLLKEGTMFLRSLSLVIILLLIVSCQKDSVDYPSIESYNKPGERELMVPGPDPIIRLDSTIIVPTTTVASWERYLYVDKTDTLISSTQGKNTFARYVSRYGFTGVYFYSTSTILSSNSNYTNLSAFLKQLSDNGVAFRAVAKGSASSFSNAGDVTRFNNTQADPARRINRANLELEWWNGASTWNNWNTINQQIALGSIVDNDFYEGWYKNLGSTIDTIAAKDQIRFSDRILLHCYQNGIPTYSYANAKSSGATGGRLDIIAKGARQANKRIDLYIIISAENTAWGASNTFTGPALAAASNQQNPFLYIEQQAYSSIFNGMTTFQKQWINLKGFIWFTKRYCYRAVPPR